ncbi:MAG: carboxypeptidase M32 [Bacilli bacterium]|nr:carboxypeptidase M32 [Bacilli bacterium]
MDELIQKYQAIRNKMLAYRFASFIINWDSNTEAPSGSFEARSRHFGILSEDSYKFSTSEETLSVIEELYKNRNSLDEVLKHEIVEAKTSIDKLKKVPMDEYVEYMTLLAKSENIWAKAKNTNDWNLFEPILEKIVAFLRKYVEYTKTPKLQGYNILLDEYEKGMTQADYDEFFNTIKTDLVPFVKEVTSKTLEYNNSFESHKFPIEKQKEFMKYIMEVMDYDLTRGLMKESEHPFTSGIGTTDVRVTNHYYEDNFISSIFSGIHELGHATYEQQVDPELDLTLSGGGGSMALHESQSRFYENIIGRSKEFWKEHYPVLKDLFKKELKGIKLDDFYKHINKSTTSLIRTEADELTYPIHIMIRYDIEKALFNNELEVKDLPKVWKQKVKEYLNIEVPSDKEGVLQDVHWSGGMFGYFPTYALGSAYASQMFKVMNKDFNVFKSLSSKNTKEINAWFKENLHKYGSSKSPKDLFKLCTNQKFNPKHYVNYLIKKYTKIYNLK